MENSPSWLAEKSAYVANLFGFFWQYVDMRDGRTVAMVITALVAICLFLWQFNIRNEVLERLRRAVIVLFGASAAGFVIFGLQAWMNNA